MTKALRAVEQESAYPAIPGELTGTALLLRDGLPFKEWESIGTQLQRLEKSIRWWIGDWLAYGERTYGEMYAQAIETTGQTYGGLANAVYVSGKFDISRRRENLSWSHHQEVVSLEQSAQEAWLDRAEEEQLSVHELREQIKSKQKNIAPSVPSCKRCGRDCNWCRIELTPA